MSMVLKRHHSPRRHFSSSNKIDNYEADEAEFSRFMLLKIAI